VDDYRWFEFPERPLSARFPLDWPWLAGGQEWAEGAERFPFRNPAEAYRWLHSIRQAPRRPAACPRLFVSHRQTDDAKARRIAWLAWDEGFDYWLDVIDLDPALNQQVVALEGALGRALSKFEKAILTAAIIEMALLNCTQVLAVITSNTKGSQWVPYEYGRVKERTAVGVSASCWWDCAVLKKEDLPEYLHLAAVHDDEPAIRGWLQCHMRQNQQCPGSRRGDWVGNEPGALRTG
jgi:hypothetical protein